MVQLKLCLTLLTFALLMAGCNSPQSSTQVFSAATAHKTPIIPATETPATATQVSAATSMPIPSMTSNTVCQGKKNSPFYVEFSPVVANGKIAYSGDGVTLIDPTSHQLFPIHALRAHDLKGWDTGIVWSPGGKLLAFLYSDLGRQPGPQTSLLIADPINGNICSLLPESGRFSTPSWSPNGKYLAVTDANTRSLIVLNLTDKSFSILETDVFQGTEPHWLNDQQVAYIRSSTDGTTDLVLRPLDDSPATAILENIPGLHEFLFSLDGKWLAYYAAGLKVRNLASGEEIALGELQPVAWSPDSTVLIGKAGLGAVLIMKQQEKFSPGAIPPFGFLEEQSFSPDGHFLVLEMSGDGTKGGQIGIYDIITGEIKALNISDLYASNPAWDRQ